MFDYRHFGLSRDIIMNVFILMVLCNNLFKNEIFGLEFWDVTLDQAFHEATHKVSQYDSITK